MNILGYSGCARALPFKQKHYPDLERRAYRIAQGFDSAGALVADGQIRAAVAEERFNRIKACGDFPVTALQHCLATSGLGVDDIDHIAHGFDYRPFAADFARDPRSQEQYDEIYRPEVQQELIEAAFPGTGLADRLIPVDHHTAHAASTFMVSGFEEALVLVTDGMGESASMTAYRADHSGLQVLRKVSSLHSLGVLYGVFTLHLGFAFAMDEYKVMGLAPYGDPEEYFDEVMDLVQLREDGTYTIPILASNTTDLAKETHSGVLAELAARFGPARLPEGEMTQEHKDIAAAIQSVFQTVQLHLLRTLAAETGLRKLCLAGGCALNCATNGAVRRSRIFTEVFVQPASGDDGTALGAALWVDHLKSGRGLTRGRMGMPLWGPEFDDAAIRQAILARSDCHAQHFEGEAELLDAVAERIARGDVLGWFQGRMEYGPRALGSRSILADPTAPDMQRKINMKVKKREGFRPFAPAIAAERAHEIFELEPAEAPMFEHMLFVTHTREEWRARLPAVTHVDGSARVQTVFADRSPRLWRLCQAVGQRTGVPAVLNTSFNVRGQPIVCTPEEALETLFLADLDGLVLGQHLVLPGATGG